VGGGVGIRAASERFLSRGVPAQWLVVALAVSACRWLATSFADSWWQLVLLQALHGITFGVFLAAVIAILGRLVPSELRATGQALMYVMIFTMGSIIGNATSGLVYDALGPVALYQVSGVVEAVLILPAVVYAWRRLEAKRSAE